MPTTKLLYSKDVPNYKKWVAQYYGDIQKMNEIPPDDFANYLQDENRMHQGEFNSTFAVKEIYSYAVQVCLNNIFTGYLQRISGYKFFKEYFVIFFVVLRRVINGSER